MLQPLFIAVALILSSGAHASNSPSTPELRGKQQSSLSINGTVTTEKSLTDVRREAESDKAKASIDDAMVKYTTLTAIFTGALSVIAFFQMFLFVWQLRLMRKSAVDASTAANAAKDSAEALPKIERAYIFLESAVFAKIGTVVTVSDVNGKQVSNQNNVVEFTFKNHGNTPAILKEIFGSVRICNDFAEATNAAGTIFAAGKVISASETCSFLTELNVDAAEYEQAKAGGQQKLLLFGSIHYFDVMNFERVTGFCWKYDFQRHEFRLSLDPDHNYWK